MSLCAICYGKINDGKPDTFDEKDLGYDNCIEKEELFDYINR